jgi:DNA mismatch repair protein MutL
MIELTDDLRQLGYLIEPFGKNTFVLQGVPADVEQGNEKNTVDGLLEQFKHSGAELKLSKRERLVRTVAKQRAIKVNVRLTEREMRSVVEQLFACNQPNSTPDGKPTYLEFKKEQLEKMFGG